MVITTLPWALSKGRGFPEIAAEPDDLDVAVVPFEVAQHRERAVRAAVVDVQDLIADVHPAEHRAELGVELFQRVFLIIERNDNADVGPPLLVLLLLRLLLLIPRTLLLARLALMLTVALLLGLGLLWLAFSRRDALVGRLVWGSCHRRSRTVPNG